MTKISITPEIAEKAKVLLQHHTYPQIAKMLNVHKVTLASYFWKRGVRRLPNKGNVHYFDKVDSYAKAYIVGFIAADGSLVKTKTTATLTITIKYEDKAVLEFIKSEIGNSHQLREIRRPSSYNPSKTIHHIRYTISDMNITKALNNLGITSNKSLTMGNIIENIPYKYRDAFIIGYFDGDGSVSVSAHGHLLYITMRGTRNFLCGVCQHLDITESHVKQYDSIPTLAFAGKKDVVRLFQCYNNLPFYYKRKHDKFLQRINHSSYDKYKQVQTISSSTE